MGRKKINRAIRICLTCGNDENTVMFWEANKTRCIKCILKKRKEVYRKNKYEILKKRIEWRKRVNELPDIVTEIKRGRGRPFDVVVYQPKFDEEKIEVIEVYCTDFACGKKLNLLEKRYGNKCLKHQVYIRQIF